ncbi:SAM-dependent methyltransferase [Luteibacter sp. CQ10]|uniref:SAM-dependent methyltransferase n=1 Tax=Luteibacter sp. CQ10 TaxID=2805821 RepID=UPI0034A38247
MSTSISTATEARRGSIACVGMGITLGSHLTPMARSYIENAEVVFAALSDHVVEIWLKRMNPAFHSLTPLYSPGKSRMKTYREWVRVMMAEVRAGKRVCAVFYGHPGIFAWSPHKVIEVARAEGYLAHMEAGISAEDCLYADLGIDPGRAGCQHLEASQLLFFDRVLDTGGHVILWQLGVVGDRSLGRFRTPDAYRELLVERLRTDYPADHGVIVYRAPTLPVERPHIQRVALGDLTSAEFTGHETLVLPPARELKPNAVMQARLDALDAIHGSGRESVSVA